MYKIKLLSSLAKVFADEEPKAQPECTRLTGLLGETVSFQIACMRMRYCGEEVEIKIHSELAEHFRIRMVKQVPVSRAVCTHGDGRLLDDNFIKTTSGMYPDLLQDIVDNKVYIQSWKWTSFWFDIEIPEDAAAGEHAITIDFEKDGTVVGSVSTRLYVVGTSLPKQELIHTEWFYPDCLADYYQVEAMSEAHWDIMKNFIQGYVKRGGTMILVPLFTPPLDTGVGLERTTAQLVDVKVIKDENQNITYEFGFDKVKRFIDMCKAAGVEYFEMCHLFSQWGAKYAPKVVADVDGKQEKIFGWHTLAVGEYTNFLHAFLPELTAELKEWGIAEKCYFHVSDEPNNENMDTYMAARNSLGDLLKGFKTLDALSHYEFYEKGLVDVPVPGNDSVHEFLEHDMPERWTYYCVSQFREVSNRFMAMPSSRNRILGVQLYKYNMTGFLHWGYNFYNSQYSVRHINPYESTDADGMFAAGDSFLVYPGKGGVPEDSIRGMVLSEAMDDLRAFRLLESLSSKEFVMELIEGDLAEPITFKKYPKSDMYLTSLRNRVNMEIAKKIII